MSPAALGVGWAGLLSHEPGGVPHPQTTLGPGTLLAVRTEDLAALQLGSSALKSLVLLFLWGRGDGTGGGAG